MSSTNNIIILVARILLAFMFIFAGFGKLTDPSGTAGMIAGAGMPAATLLTYLAGTFEFVTGVCVLIGFQIRIVGWLLRTVLHFHRRRLPPAEPSTFRISRPLPTAGSTA